MDKTLKRELDLYLHRCEDKPSLGDFLENHLKQYYEVNLDKKDIEIIQSYLIKAGGTAYN